MPSVPDPTPPPPKPRKRWFPRLRFSLRTLVALVLTGGAGAFLYRNWEPWRNIAMVEQQPDEVLHDDSMLVKTIAISPDGKYFTVARNVFVADRWEPTLNVIDASNGRAIASMHGHGPNAIFCAVFSPDGSRILTGGGDGTARLWDAMTGSEQLVIQPRFQHSDYNPHITCAAFISQEMVLLAGYEGDTQAWDLKTNKAIYQFEGRQCSRDPATFVFSGGARALTSGNLTDDWTPRSGFVWDTVTGKRLSEIEMKGYDLKDEQIIENRYLWGLLPAAWREPARRVEKWDLTNKDRELVAGSQLNIGVNAYALEPSGDCIACFAIYGIQRLDGEKLKVRNVIDPSVCDATCLGVTPDGKRLISGGPAGRMQVFDLAGGGRIYEKSVEPIPNREVTELKFFPNYPERLLLVVASTDFGGWSEKPKTVHLLERRRPESWWGVAWLPEFWLTALFAGALVWSVWRDRRQRA